MPRAKEYYRKSVRALLDEIKHHRKHDGHNQAIIKHLQRMLVDLRYVGEEIRKVAQKEQEKKQSDGRL